MEFELGQTYSGYKFLDVARRSKNGVEYRVQNTFAQRMELLQVLPQSAQDDQEETDRFLREMRVRARLVHPNIVTFFTAMPLEGRLVMTTELTEGLPLSERLKLGPIHWQEAVDFIRQVLSAVNCAHEQKIVHRDITPDNIIAIPGGALKLTNFRLAKTINSLALTQNGAIQGNLKYISPEQVKGTDGLDFRSDVYSIGIVFYEMLAGRTPFHSTSQFEVMLAHVNQQPDPPSRFTPSLPPQLDAVVLKSLAKVPEDRYQSAREFEQALLQVAEPGGRRNLESSRPAPAAVEPAHVEQALVLAASAFGAPAVVSAPVAAPEPILEALVAPVEMVEAPVEAVEAHVEAVETLVGPAKAEPITEAVFVETVPEPTPVLEPEPVEEPVAAAVVAEPAPEIVEASAAEPPSVLIPEPVIEPDQAPAAPEAVSLPADAGSTQTTPAVEPEPAAEPVAACAALEAPPAEAAATEVAPSAKCEAVVEPTEPLVEASVPEPPPVAEPEPAAELAPVPVVAEPVIETVKPAPALLPETAVYASLWSVAEAVANAAESPAISSVREPAPVPVAVAAAAPPMPTPAPAVPAPILSQPHPAAPDPTPSPYDAPAFFAAVQSRSESVQWAFFGGTAAFLGVIWVAIWLVAGK